MFKKILPLLVVVLTVGFAVQTQAQSVTVTIGGSSTGAPLTITAAKTDITCNTLTDGTVTATLAGGNGGTPAYTITRTAPGALSTPNTTGASSGTFSGLPAGTYTVSVVSNSCSATSASVVVAEPTALTASITAQTNVLCFGNSTGAVTVAGAGGTGASNSASFTYTISGPSNVTGATNGNFTGLAAGSYTVTVTKGTCTTTQAVTITQPTAALAASFTVPTVQIACGATTAASGTVTVTGGTTTYSYAWSSAGVGATNVSAETGASIAALTAGAYTVTVTDANSCVAPSATVTITAPNSTLAATVTATQILCNTVTPGASGSTTGTIAVTNVVDGSANAVTGATYTWTGGTTTQTATESGLAAATYTVVVSKIGYCPSPTYSRTINAAPAAVSATSGSLVDDGCQTNTGSVVLTGTGGATGVTYQMKWVSATLNPATPARPTAVGSPNQNVYTSAGATGTFTGLTGGYDYRFVIRDSNGCTTPE